jgi:hypothetical protein
VCGRGGGLTVPSLPRLLAVLQADLRARLRRPGVAVLLVASAVSAVLMIPDPRPGQGLLQVAGARALYTSPTLAFATAMLLALVLSFFGFSVAGHALGRDLRSRVGTIVAASPVTDLEYLAGKLLGSIALLTVVGAGFMVACMAMQVVRGEGPLEPLTYLAHYAVLGLPCIAWVAVLSLLFECTSGLSGRLGDVAYFFVWAASFLCGFEGWRPGGPKLLRVFDYMGFGFVVRQVEAIVGTSQFTIGYAPGDPTKPPIHFPGLSFPPDALAARAASLVAPLVLFPLALVLFRRFDPARTRVGGRGRFALPAWLGRLVARLVRPLLTPLARLAPDVALTFRARPLLAVAALAFAAVSLGLPAADVRVGLLPVVFALVSLALADHATRERGAGLLGVVYAAPGRREHFAEWKLAGALGVALVIGGVPALRLLPAEPGAGVSALVGLGFLAAASVAAGIASGTPKTFMALALALWYLALSSKGQQPALDYGGWWAVATPAVQAGWLTATLVAAALAVAAQRYRLSREG